MRGLLTVLTAIASLAALFLGGCALAGVAQWFMPPRFVDTYQRGGDADIALFSLLGGLVATGLLVTNVALLRSLVRGRPLGRKTAVRVLAFVDLAMALLGFALVSVSWLLAAVVGAGFAAKGLLTLSWAASQPPVAPSGPPPAS